MERIAIRAIETRGDVETLRVLLREYGTHLTGTLGGQNVCMVRYEEELGSLPLPYEMLLLAFAGDEAAGCVLLKTIARVNETACEMKRLWVRPQFRGLGAGRKLAESAIAKARQHGYTAMYLDTVPFVMQAAHRMYQELGFEPIERYNDNQVSDVQFFRRAL